MSRLWQLPRCERGRSDERVRLRYVLAMARPDFRMPSSHITAISGLDLRGAMPRHPPTANRKQARGDRSSRLRQPDARSAGTDRRPRPPQRPRRPPADAADHPLDVNSGFQAVFDPDECVSCNICIERCPREALSMGEDDVPVVNLGRCFGCGVCATSCPDEAIRMVNKPGFPGIPKDPRALREAMSG